jgi:23S rRNA (uracil1939-C5)-methyltransferase
MRRVVRAVTDPLREVMIEALGDGGDGIATTAEGRLFVPGVLPGERVRVRIISAGGEASRAEALERLNDSAERQAPPCAHFGRCGGCALQHLADQPYGRWKAGLVRTALARRGLASDIVLPLVPAEPGSRRRLRLAGLRRKGGFVLGLREGRGHTIIDLDECPITRPGLVALLAPLRQGLAPLVAERTAFEISLNETSSGIDVLCQGLTISSSADLAKLAALAEALSLARLSLAAEAGGAVQTVAMRAVPMMHFGGVAVRLPPGVFLQASAAGEAAIVAAVSAAARGVHRLVDLYCGIGTLSLPLVQAGLKLSAYDRDEAAIAALDRAVRGGGLAGRLLPSVRDLARAPLRPTELRGVDAALFDPPRAGAPDQARALAESDLPLVIAVSCNPASFARDAKLLLAGGFRLESVQPIDQFLWSPHVELIAVFRR